jgi:hypothetical protein
MGKIVLWLSLIGFSLIFILGVVAPNSSVMWLASTSLNFSILRIVVIAFLCALLVTNPPRNIVLRAVVAIAAIMLASWTISLTYQYQMKFLDTLGLLEVSIASLLTIWEKEYLLWRSSAYHGH